MSQLYLRGNQNYQIDYHPRDIYNMDETGLFFRDSGNRSFFVKGQDCHGGKWSKDRISVMLCKYDWGEGTISSYWKIMTTKVFW